MVARDDTDQADEGTEAGAGDGAVFINDGVKGTVLEKVGGVGEGSRSSVLEFF